MPAPAGTARPSNCPRSEEHTSELQSRSDLVCRLLLEKKKKYNVHCLWYLRTAAPKQPSDVQMATQMDRERHPVSRRRQVHHTQGLTDLEDCSISAGRT